ncbi:response regulator receiver protein [Emticicia oligotrophica DSM 17448]|uniref:Response regulator receiver protein n=1 Tax=Emticicia oligotrophica (strain DSM 17448 / CIP 109782 / MTCC 6937 / GPTSA100-15) TaxID=929562 RepID=A0ABM5N5Z3_EMTOG|nr:MULTISPECIES: response regulator [Emticicia]AFK04931.1 response regulator receiver protein [Emticicia oligotrophica DSM 17448]
MNIQKNIKVLIVDDEPNILLSLEFLMKKEGFIVFIARDGEEAFDIINREKPRIVLLDIMMPKVDGYEVCKFIKSNKDTSDTKVVFLSAKSKEADIEKGYSIGADLYIPKPFSTRDLVKKINMMAAGVVA